MQLAHVAGDRDGLLHPVDAARGIGRVDIQRDGAAGPGGVGGQRRLIGQLLLHRRGVARGPGIGLREGGIGNGKEGGGAEQCCFHGCG